MAMFYGQIVIGSAGSGKSTYCHAVQDMAQILKRKIIVINLDPAAEYFKYQCDIDIRDLISLEDVMEELHLGPNGGLVYCMEYLLLNSDWLQQELNNIATDDYVLIDCPGQIELYTHMELMSRITKILTNIGFSLCTVYMLDVNFITDDSKYLSGLLMALSASMSMQLPHFTILTKCDLITNKKTIKKYLKLSHFSNDHNDQFEANYEGLTQCTLQLVESFGGLRLLAMDLSDEDSVQNILTEIDYAIQYGDNLESDDKAFDKVDEKMMAGSFQDQLNL